MSRVIEEYNRLENDSLEEDIKFDRQVNDIENRVKPHKRAISDLETQIRYHKAQIRSIEAELYTKPKTQPKKDLDIPF